MLKLNNLQKLKKNRKRVGRGGSRGGTSGRGHKGQRARSGGKTEIRPFFEGGQMPLSRRLPRRGFTNIFKKEYLLINLKDLENVFSIGDVVDNKILRSRGIMKGKVDPLVKILGNGQLTKKLDIYADAFSKSARDAIEKAGGFAKKRELKKVVEVVKQES